MQERPTGFNVRGYEKFIDMISDSMLQQTFKKLPLVKHWYSFKGYPQLTEKVIKTLPHLFQLHIHVRLYFLHIVQPTQHTATE